MVMNIDLYNIPDKAVKCRSGREVTIPVRRIKVEHGAVNTLPEVINELGYGKNIYIVCDRHTREVLGDQAVAILSGAGLNISMATLEDGEWGKVEPDEAGLDAIAANRPDGVDLVIGVGGGTINDLSKFSAAQWKIPYLVCPTAPSMNGYTSAISALLLRGLRVTEPADPPQAVIADLDVLEKAPPKMIRSGLADLFSKPVNSADWFLAHTLWGSYYDQTPLDVVEEPVNQCWKLAAAIGRAEPEAIKILTEALLYSGISMVIAGSSGPASGGEHLISHYWDMTQKIKNRPPALHGAQVGIGTLVTASLYAHLRKIKPDQVDLRKLQDSYPEWPEIEALIKDIYGDLAGPVIEQSREAYREPNERITGVKKAFDNWDELWKKLDRILKTPREIREVLQETGAPTCIEEIHVSEEDLRNAYLYSRLIRARYTVLDFAADLGVLESLTGEVLADSGVM